MVAIGTDFLLIFPRRMLEVTVVVPDSGAFSVPVMIPASAKAGRHRLIAVGDDGSRASATITVS
jgi:hypothetical protein